MGRIGLRTRGESKKEVRETIGKQSDGLTVESKKEVRETIGKQSDGLTVVD